jgi:hypothetical protein
VVSNARDNVWNHQSLDQLLETDSRKWREVMRVEASHLVVALTVPGVVGEQAHEQSWEAAEECCKRQEQMASAVVDPKMEEAAQRKGSGSQSDRGEVPTWREARLHTT